MSTSILYHGFGIHGYQYVRTIFEQGKIVFKVTQNQFDLKCSKCNSSDIIRKGSVLRRFKTLPIGQRPVIIECPIQRVKCRCCGITRQVKVAFADNRRTYTKAFELYVLSLSRCMTIRDIAEQLFVSWDVIKDIQKRNLKKNLESQS